MATSYESLQKHSESEPNNGYNNIFLVGNGFDLAVGLNTSYSDFVKYSRKGNPEGKRIFQKLRRRKLDQMINEQLAEMEEMDNAE